MKLLNFIFALSFFAGDYTIAQSNFSYKRGVEGIEAEGWYSIPLPPEIFSQLNRDLSDLRLYSVVKDDTVEVPYHLKMHLDEGDPSIVRIPVVNKSRRNGVLYLMFELPLSVKVNYLDLRFAQLNFFGSVNIEGSNDKNQWYEINRNQRIVSIKNEIDSYTLQTINFPVTDYHFLRVSISADVPLSFTEATFHHDGVKKGMFENIPLRWTTRTEKKFKRSVVDINLENVVPVSSLDIKIDSTRDYYRAFSIDYVTDSVKTQKGWIKNYETIYDGYLTSFKSNRFTFSGQLMQYIRLTIDNLDNAPLAIERISAERPLMDMISFLKPGEHILLYGNKKVRKPVYDLAYFENKIPDTLSVAKLRSAVSLETSVSKRKPLFENKLWLWSIMGLMIGGLGFFTIKMMKAKK